MTRLEIVCVGTTSSFRKLHARMCEIYESEYFKKNTRILQNVIMQIDIALLFRRYTIVGVRFWIVDFDSWITEIGFSFIFNFNFNFLFCWCVCNSNFLHTGVYAYSSVYKWNIYIRNTHEQLYRNRCDISLSWDFLVFFFFTLFSIFIQCKITTATAKESISIFSIAWKILNMFLIFTFYLCNILFDLLFYLS